MESYLHQLKSIPDSWMSPSSVSMVMDMIFGVMCGVGLFFLLIPFLKNYPVSPPPESEKNTPKVVRRGRSKTRKNTASVKGDSRVHLRTGCRDDRENVEEAEYASQPVESPIKHHILDSTPHAFWNSNKKLDQLSLSQLLCYLKVLEDLIQQKSSRIFWGMSSMLSESVVATAWVSSRSSSVETKTSSCCNTYSPFPALTLTQEPPQISQAKPLPHQLMTPTLADVTEVQTLYSLPNSTPNQTLSSSTSRACVKANETRIQASLSSENQSWQQDLEWKDKLSSNIQKHQAAICQPTHLPRATPPTEAIRPASTFPEHPLFPQHHEELQRRYRMTKGREQHGAPSGVLPSRERTQLQGHFPTNSPCWSKNQPGLPQTGQPFILDSKSCKLSQMRGSVPSGVPLKKGPAKHKIQDAIKEGLSFRAEDLPCTSSSSPEKGLEARNPAPRTDERSYVNTTQDLAFLDPQTQRKLESNITPRFPQKHRLRPHLQTLESGDLTLPRVPTSSLSQPMYPTSPTCVSKSEYYPKASMNLEKLHHRDPGGRRAETVSATRVQSPLFTDSPSEVQVMQTATPAAAVSHRSSKARPDAWRSDLSTRAKAYCLLARTQQSRTVRGIGRGSLQQGTSQRIVRNEPWEIFENVVSGHWSSTVVKPEIRTPSSVVKQTSRIEKVKKETPPPWKVTLGSSSIPNGQNINNNLRNFKFVEANRNPSHFQTCPEHSRGPAQKPQVISEVDINSNKQPQAWPAGLLPDHQRTVCPTTVSLPSQHPLPRFESRSPNPKTFQGLRDMFMRREHNQEIQKLTAPNNVIPSSNHKILPPREEKMNFIRSRSKSQEENLGRMGLSQDWDLNSSTPLNDTVITESQPSLDKPENKQAPARGFLKKILRNILQYFNFSIKNKDQGGSLKNESPPQCSTQTQEIVTKQNFMYNMAAEVQCLIKVVVQILMDRLGLDIEDSSKVQWCKVDPLMFYSPEGLYDTKKRMSSGLHTGPNRLSHPFTYKETAGRQQLGAGAQKACEHQNRVKRGKSFDQLPTLKGKTNPFLYKGMEDKQKSVTASKTAYDPEQMKGKSGMSYCPYSSPNVHNPPFLYREIGNKQPLDISHRVCDPHLSTKKEMGYDHLSNLRENNHPVMYRGTGDKEQSYAAAQRAGHPKCTLTV